ncbi:LamB/YcsF family protein [Ferroacidibacillus organovorans]|uniref:5-oxoprolinase (ATP-hydrolyzing) subunit A n=3 Tax=Ferroacidibacillus organovorans TaxID=1765683 RepID=A0A1V4EWK9_9BACL|nr:5-oxoprolinase subunit PxpA [Ferroacidibacillus organovorans]OAG93073.1 hypothetical protein AYW79_12570 [Ferroacidibacillus organovorans]OPG17281.1 hypothetical protein B2M26_02850 [Ferroacidibacillus organovorans]
MRIDFNADLGEGFGPYTIGDDEAVLDVVTSANLACGFHAGDPNVMMERIEMAQNRGVRIGAHPGYADRIGFGRRDIPHADEEWIRVILYQWGALAALATQVGARVTHLKMHGALYHKSAYSSACDRLVEAICKMDDRVVLFAPCGSPLAKAGRLAGLSVCEEMFADRSYEPDGTLTPRNVEGAIFHDPEMIARRIVDALTQGTIAARDGTSVPLRADTVCIHGDHAGAVETARTLKLRLQVNGVVVAPYGIG